MPRRHSRQFYVYSRLAKRSLSGKVLAFSSKFFYEILLCSPGARLPRNKEFFQFHAMEPQWRTAQQIDLVGKNCLDEFPLVRSIPSAPLATHYENIFLLHAMGPPKLKRHVVKIKLLFYTIVRMRLALVTALGRGTPPCYIIAYIINVDGTRSSAPGWSTDQLTLTAAAHARNWAILGNFFPSHWICEKCATRHCGFMTWIWKFLTAWQLLT